MELQEILKVMEEIKYIKSFGNPPLLKDDLYYHRYPWYKFGGVSSGICEGWQWYSDEYIFRYTKEKDRRSAKKQMEKYYNDAIIGNKNLKATFSKKGELLRLYYPNIDFRQFIDEFTVGIKVNDSRLINLADDVNNVYSQSYIEQTNILNTEIVNTYFNLKVVQTDCISSKENILIKRYKFINNHNIKLNIDLLSMSGHKFHGPKGVGALFVSNDIKIDPIIFGGNQERHKRGGTTDIAGIVGFGKACEIADRDMKTNNHKVRGISDYFATKLASTIEHVKFNVETKQKLPQIISVNFVGVNAESLMPNLDLNGVAVSSGCEDTNISHVLSALGIDNDSASCSIRFSFGKNNSYEEIDKAISIISICVEDLRSYSSTFGMKIRKRKGDK